MIICDLMLQLANRKLSKLLSSWLSLSTMETLRPMRKFLSLTLHSKIYQGMVMYLMPLLIIYVYIGPTGRFVILVWLPLSLRPWATWWKDMTFIAFTLRMVRPKIITMEVSKRRVVSKCQRSLGQVIPATLWTGVSTEMSLIMALSPSLLHKL